MKKRMHLLFVQLACCSQLGNAIASHGSARHEAGVRKASHRIQKASFSHTYHIANCLMQLACDQLGNSYAPACKAYVDTYAPTIFSMVQVRDVDWRRRL